MSPTIPENATSGRGDGSVGVAELRPLLAAMTALRDGDFQVRMPVEQDGIVADLANVFNQIIERRQHSAAELGRVCREVVRQGHLDARLSPSPGRGAWTANVETANSLIDALVAPTTGATRVLDAVASGDLTQRMELHDGNRPLRGDLRRHTRRINQIVDQLSLFTSEVTRLAREVGTEGRLGRRARVQGLSGTWRDVTESLNTMADRLTAQVRDIAVVTKAVASGDLTRSVTVEATGELLELKRTVNTMVDQLSAFADEVTRVAREVGTEGRLGGQARVEGVHGTWKHLTTNVNELAANLTTQVRAIADVTSAVAQGDMSRYITVETHGEVSELKDNINRMVSNLRDTTRAKDWLESNLTRLARLMQGHRDLVEVADLILRELTPLVSAQYGAFFLAETAHDPFTQPKGLALIASYGMQEPAAGAPKLLAQGLVRQAALEKKRILIEEVPTGYIRTSSGLGESAPTSIVIIPIIFEDKLLGLIELASFHRFSDVHLAFFDQFVDTIGVAINTILANARTEALLGESQRLAEQLQERSDELQRQQAELRRSNEKLADKAAQLASSSQYKSEFLANMSHELRTPLSSMLIYARLLADNVSGGLSPEEVNFATSIHRSGSDLLELINDILDLSKVEAGRLNVRPEKVPLAKLIGYVNATFRPIALDRGLDFEIDVAEHVPPEIYSDEHRLRQILRNLLSNAVKFTSEGWVKLHVKPAEPQRDVGDVLAFTVEDTGIGIRHDKLAMIFEAFEQAYGTTGHMYGGTGLGLSISRELACLLGGRITVESEPGRGSSFTLYIPVVRRPASAPSGESAPGDEAGRAQPARGDIFAAEADDAVRWAMDQERADRSATAARAEKRDAERAARTLPGKALIVDDDIRIVVALTQLFGRMGMPALYALNGREAIEILERDPEVSLVLMDIMMPVMDGYEAIKAIRHIPRYVDLPIVALSAKAISGEREKVLANGANAYLQKPIVEVDQLLKVAYDLLAPGQASEESRAVGGDSDMERADDPERPSGSGSGSAGSTS